MGPDSDGHLANFAREDFTLLNLSKSSSSASSSDELFAHQQHQLPPSNPNKKKRLRLKRRGGYSVRQNRSSEESSQVRSRGLSPLALGYGSSSTVICALILLLLCWSATLSWLMFSLRNELMSVNANLAASEALTKDLPMELAKMNQTIETLEGTVAALSALTTNLQTQLNNYGKNMTDTNGLVKDLQKNLGLLGSKESELSAKVEELQKASKEVKAVNASPDS